MGSYFGDVGDRLVLTTSKGNEIKVIIIDEKATEDTKGNSVQKTDGSMVEFVISTDKLANSYSKVMNTGNISSIKKFSGKVIKVVKVK